MSPHQELVQENERAKTLLLNFVKYHLPERLRGRPVVVRLVLILLEDFNASLAK